MARTRFAPSPTGFLHIGGVRTALFNWLFAKKQGGAFILRIDDTDSQRNVNEALQPILDGFRWLGLDWDEGPDVGGEYGPYFQSQRAERYASAVERLLASGAAYQDFATSQEIQAEREAAEKAKIPFVYSRKWMAETDRQRTQFESEGRSAVVRLKMPREGTLALKDAIRGEVRFDWAREQDQVIQRTDGTCLYHLATVVDDHDMQISHIIRAEEHLSNTPRQVFIAQALGYELPVFAHVPFVAEPGSKNKLSKRKLDKYLKNKEFAALNEKGQHIAERTGMEVTADTFNPVIVDFYAQTGFLPAAITNYLLLLGWSLDDKTEFFTTAEMIDKFSLERVNKAPASFDPQKLVAFQSHYMNELPVKKKVAKTVPFLQQAGLVSEPPPCETATQLTPIIEAAGDRLVIAGDILQFDDFFIPDDQLQYDEKGFEKRLANAPDSVELLKAFREKIPNLEPFEAANLETEIKSFLDERDAKIGQIIHALRVALTGKTVGFGMFETMEILGRQQCAARIDRALAIIAE